MAGDAQGTSPTGNRPDGLGSADESAGDELEELRASHARFRAWVESLPEFVSETDIDGRFRFVNRTDPGVDRANVIGRSLYDFLPETEHARVREIVDDVLRSRKSARFQTEVVGPSGTLRIMQHTVGAVVRDDRAVGLAFTSTDVTASAMRERALAEREELMRLAVLAARIGFWSWDARTDTVHWDDATCDAFGVPHGRGPRRVAEFLTLIHPLDRDRVAHQIRGFLESGMYAGMECRTLTDKGHIRWIATTGTVTFDDDGKAIGFRGAAHDVTARRAMDERRQQPRQLEALGQLAAGVAHNFNNLLAAALPCIELASQHAPETRPILEPLRESASNAADVVRQLLSFVRGAEPGRPRREAVASVVARVAAHLRLATDANVRVVSQCDDKDMVADVDASALEQALMNLAINARDAVLEAPEQAEPRIEIAAFRDSGERGGSSSVAIRVRDNGCGMDAATRERVFEPFFTTKGAGHGTGIGLPSVAEFAASVGGDVTVESALREGTTVVLRVPELERGLPSPSVRARQSERPASARITLVDDDAAVRTAVAMLLRDEGYEVRAYGDPESALDAHRADPGFADLVILDESLPGCAGSVLLSRMRAISPHIQAISFSGLGDLPEMDVFACLPKPTPPHVLLATVVDALQSPRGTPHLAG